MQRVKVDLIDDMDKKTEAVETLRFGVNGTRYEIDLSADHVAEFNAALEPFISNARKGGRTVAVPRPAVGKRAAKPDRDQLAAMRQWGKDHGYEVSDKGRVPVSVQEAYHAAQKAPAKPRRARKRS